MPAYPLCFMMINTALTQPISTTFFQIKNAADKLCKLFHAELFISAETGITPVIMNGLNLTVKPEYFISLSVAASGKF